MAGAMVLEQSASGSLGGLLRNRLLGSIASISESVDLEWGLQGSFLVSSQVLLQLPVWGANFEKHGAGE